MSKPNWRLTSTPAGLSLSTTCQKPSPEKFSDSACAPAANFLVFSQPRSTTMTSLKELKETLAFSCNILAYEGHWDNILGHVSVRIPGKERILMKPHSFGFEEIRPEHIIEVDLDGKKVGGKYERHSEVFIHTEIFKARPDVNCVVHSHPPYAVALGSLRQPLRPISHEGNIF